MGKTHSSGIAVGDVAMGIFGGAMLCQSYRFDITTGTAKTIYFNEPSLIRDVFVTNDAGVGAGATVKLGSTAGGSEHFTGAVLATAPSTVLKKVQGTVYVDNALVNSTLWITYATGGA